MDRRILVLLALVACRSAEGPVAAGPADLQQQIADYCLRSDQALIAVSARCSGAPVSYAQRFWDHADPERVSGCTEKLFDDASDARICFDAALVELCVSTIASQACVDFEARALPIECRGVITGLLADGAICAGPSDVCAPGLECLGHLSSGFCGYRCRTRQPAGAACTDSFDCAGAAACDDHLCIPYPSRGERCTDRCQHDSYCKNEVCAPLDAEGAACHRDPAFAFVNSCEPGLRCVQSLCTTRSKLGERCSTEEDACATLTTCIDGTCALHALPGDRCTTTCFAGTCSPAGLCLADQREKPKKPAGSRCTTSEQCESGVCTDSRCQSWCF